MPYNFFKQFKKACKQDRKNVILWGKVLDDAEKDFNLRTPTQLYEFILQGGLEDLTHQNSKKWGKNPKPEDPILVHAYTFRTMCKIGYIAIMYNNANKWIIKSFKRSIVANSSMQMAFKKALIDLKGK